jgi:hypothetical protein
MASQILIPWLPNLEAFAPGPLASGFRSLGFPEIDLSATGSRSIGSLMTIPWLPVPDPLEPGSRTLGSWPVPIPLLLGFLNIILISHSDLNPDAVSSLPCKHYEYRIL